MKTEEIIEKIAKLKTDLTAIEKDCQALASDLHLSLCPFVAPVRAPVTAALERIEHLEKWIIGNPVPETPAAPAIQK